MSRETVQNRTLIIIPAYSEQRNIAGVIGEAKGALPCSDVLVVDDGSRDQTRQIALKSGVNVVSHVFNLGYGAALETGYLYAIKGNYEFVIQMDGDGQHLASELPKLIKILQNNEADVVVGSRKGSNYTGSISRKIGQKLFSKIIYMLSGFQLGDSTSGFQGLNNKALSLFANGDFPHDYPDADVILMSKFAGLKIKEVPVRMLTRKQGVSMHSGIKPFYYVLKMFLSIFIVYLNRKSFSKYSDVIACPEVRGDGASTPTITKSPKGDEAI